MGPTPTTEVDVFLATHGWWPWLLTLAVIIVFVAYVVAHFVRRRRVG
jgi:cytochrome b561